MTEVRAVIESQFEELQAVVERAKREVTEILEGEEKQALRQAEGIRVHLEQRCTELKKTQAQMEKLSRNKNDVDFLQVKAPGLGPKHGAVDSFSRKKIRLKAAKTLTFLFLNGTGFVRVSAGLEKA